MDGVWAPNVRVFTRGRAHTGVRRRTLLLQCDRDAINIAINMTAWSVGHVVGRTRFENLNASSSMMDSARARERATRARVSRRRRVFVSRAFSFFSYF